MWFIIKGQNTMLLFLSQVCIGIGKYNMQTKGLWELYPCYWYFFSIAKLENDFLLMQLRITSKL